MIKEGDVINFKYGKIAVKSKVKSVKFKNGWYKLKTKKI